MIESTWDGSTAWQAIAGFFRWDGHNGGMAQPIVITSMDDERIAVFRDVRDADLRGRDKFFMAESEMVVRRLLRSP